MVLFSAILGIWIFLVRLKGGAILCYFVLFSAILGSSATPYTYDIIELHMKYLPTTPHPPIPTQFLLEVYSLYTDYVLKNPFYNVDQFGIGQPIRVEQFETKLEAKLREFC